jgi:hypothetical protein
MDTAKICTRTSGKCQNIWVALPALFKLTARRYLLAPGNICRSRRHGKCCETYSLRMEEEDHVGKTTESACTITIIRIKGLNIKYNLFMACDMHK